MANYVQHNSIDLLLGDIADSDEMHVCESLPANYAAVAGVTLGVVSMTIGDGNDYTLAAADGGNGRKVIIAAKTITATGTGTGTHLVLVDTVDTELRVANEISNVSMTDTESKDFASWDIPITY